MYYCERCMLLGEGPRCVRCGSKRLRAPHEGDFCLLDERQRMWADMLLDVLAQSGIPCVGRSALGAGLFSFSGVIKRGDFDRVLLRPCGALTQVLGSKFDLTRFGRLTTGVVGLAWGIAHLDTPFGLAQGAMTALCIFSGVMLFLGILMIQGGTCFWTIEGMEAFNAITYGGVAMASYPLEVYRGWLREVFLFGIPLGCLNYLPCAVLFGKSLPYPAFTAYLAPVAGGTFLLLGWLVWRAGMRRYRSAGA